MTIKSLKCKTTSIDLTALIHEFLETCIEVEMPIKRCITKFRVSALYAKRYARSI